MEPQRNQPKQLFTKTQVCAKSKMAKYAELAPYCPVLEG